MEIEEVSTLADTREFERRDDAELLQRGLLLEYATLSWNVVGACLLAIVAIDARSVALAGFGLDSLIEIFASVVVVWQLKGAHKKRERTALSLIAIAFVALAAYVLGQFTYTLWNGSHPMPSKAGLTWLAATVVAMLLLAWGKQVTGKKLGNQVLSTEARVTLIDAYLAAAVLGGVGLNTAFGWWWADPVSSLVIVYYGVREAIGACQHSGETEVALD
jgi:divalent metal cation (Fe/Co/Zn/Cd) transporter